MDVSAIATIVVVAEGREPGPSIEFPAVGTVVPLALLIRSPSVRAIAIPVAGTGTEAVEADKFPALADTGGDAVRACASRAGLQEMLRDKRGVARATPEVVVKLQATRRVGAETSVRVPGPPGAVANAVPGVALPGAATL